jgi:hypothetical protein
MIKKIFRVGKLNVSFILKHRWEKNLDHWDKDKWNELRLGPYIRFHKTPHKSLMIGFYLIVAKTWFTFFKTQ